MNDIWQQLDLTKIDTPCLIIDRDKVEYNIQQAIVYAKGVDRLRPHVKTHKILEVAKMQMQAGIYKFKCATIAEAEMLGMAGAKDVLIAYALQGPKIDRYLKLIKKFPQTNYSSLVDERENINLLNQKFEQSKVTANVYIDINNGQNRSGIKVKKARRIVPLILEKPNVQLAGLHCYDGHIRMASIDDRIKNVVESFSKVEKFQQEIESIIDRKLNIVAGGSPTFSVHAQYHEVECSPGTWIFWDQRYAQDYKEHVFQKAAVLATRVISQIDKYHYCLDIGHKSVASEFPFPRVEFTPKLKSRQMSQSEEHLVIKCKRKNKLKVGQVLFAYPYHICPTVALYDSVNVAVSDKFTETWKVIARDRKITV